MQSAQSLWHEFLSFCAGREPDDWLAVDFVLERNRTLNRAYASQYSQRDLQTLQLLLTWRARNTPRDEIVSRG